LTQLLLDTAMTPEQQDLVDSIKLSAGALLNTVNEMLDFSKMEAGFFQLNMGPCHIRRAVRHACDVIGPLMQQKNLELVCFIDPQLPLMVHGDEERFKQLLVNLLGNACKYTNHGVIQLRVQSDLLADKQVRLIVTIQDTGIGIPLDKQHLLFQQFTQLHNPSDVQTPVHSTGLGLAICKTIVDLMQGDIGAISKPGKGSTFWFTLTANLIESYPKYYLPYRQLLLIEENATVRQIRQDVFAALGCRVITEPDVKGILRHPLVDAVVLSYPFDDHQTDTLCTLVEDLMTDGVPVFCLVNSRTRPMLPFAVSGLLYRPLNTDSLLEHMLNPVKYLPLVAANLPPHFPQTIPESAVIPMPAQGHVLVAEDNLVNQKVVCKFLDQLRYTYDVARNGQQALNAIKTNHYDAVLMDCQMPDMDGYEASLLVRQQLGLLHLPIIALTAHAMPGERQKCLDAGMNDYLSKPLAKQHLANMLSQYIQPSEVLSPLSQ
jgi:two-component system, sensor histidine kinase and response regulator